MKYIRLVMAALAAATLCLAVAGCAEERILNDRGVACVSQDGTWPEGIQTFVEDEPLHIIIRFHDCLSTSCDTDRHAECELSANGTELVVRGRASYVDERGPGSSCTEDCGQLTATCVTDPLPAGTYTISYGGDELDVTIPGPVGVYCVGPDQ